MYKRGVKIKLQQYQALINNINEIYILFSEKT